jgi:hypothetical protein
VALVLVIPLDAEALILREGGVPVPVPFEELPLINPVQPVSARAPAITISEMKEGGKSLARLVALRRFIFAIIVILLSRVALASAERMGAVPPWPFQTKGPLANVVAGR